MSLFVSLSFVILISRAALGLNEMQAFKAPSAMLEEVIWATKVTEIVPGLQSELNCAMFCQQRGEACDFFAVDNGSKSCLLGNATASNETVYQPTDIRSKDKPVFVSTKANLPLPCEVCTFPFVYKETKYTDCANLPEISTEGNVCFGTVDYHGEAESGSQILCSLEGCPDNTKIYKERCKLCVFPYNFNGTVMTECDNLDDDPNGTWCATGQDGEEEVGSDYIYCPPEGCLPYL